MATVVDKINPNFEKIGKIQVLSSSKATSEELEGKIFGGYGYSANVQVNNGDGYSITIRVISRDGRYTIDSSKLNATKIGSKNIVIGNFTFYDFYLINYTIEKEVDSSILSLTYKDKSIFMDKVYIGLLGFDYSFSFKKTITKDGKIISSINKPTNIVTRLESASFLYKCENSIDPISAFIRRELSSVITPGYDVYKNLGEEFERNKTYDFLNSKAFYSKYNYNKNGVNGGSIVLGAEQMKEDFCSLPDVNYCFKDLLSALHYSEIPGLLNFNLGQNTIYKSLRRKYFGTLRSVLNNWGADFGFKFYFQPKIKFYKKDYSNLNNKPTENYITEGLKYIDLKSGDVTLDNLNTLFNPNLSSYNVNLQKVIRSISESASLEGTNKSTVLTPIRRDARAFKTNYDLVYPKEGSLVDFSKAQIPPKFGSFSINADFLIRSTFLLYNESLRDVYAWQTGSYSILGISNLSYVGGEIKSFNSFLEVFIPAIGGQVQDVLNVPQLRDTLLNYYNFYVGVYDEDQYKKNIDLEKELINNYYNKFVEVSLPSDSSNCRVNSNSTFKYSTEPSYSDEFYVNGNPLIKVDNPFDSRNESQMTSLLSVINPNGSIISKGVQIVDFKNQPTAWSNFLICLTPQGQKYYKNLLSQYGKLSLILVPKYAYLNISNISLVNDFNNSSLTVEKNKSLAKYNTEKTKGDCNKTICEQSLADALCFSNQNTASSNSIVQGFKTNSCLAIKIETTGGNFYLRLPCNSSYQYSLIEKFNGTATYSSASFVQGDLPDSNSPDSNLYDNVLSVNVVKNDVPESLVQAESSNGIQDQILIYDTDAASGKKATITNVIDYHDIVKKQLGSSVLKPHQQKTIALTSTYVPIELVDYIFNNPILNSMNFTISESGFEMAFDFQSRPKELKPKDVIFVTEQFLKIL